MASPSSLNTLIELAQNNADQAAKQLQQLNSTRRDAEQQLNTLKTYRQDYAERLQKATEDGISASNYHNFRQFIATLDEAIAQQNKVLAQIGAKLESGRQSWYDEKRRLNSYATLLSRQVQQRTIRDNRKEQRDNDEISARQLRRSGKVH
ncbi:flagella biosynthesis chaperone FliJ [Paralcaligenes sp. KSB-10]|uniref:flagellar export protein FliJ n=1 Tax=Paralcaligenes sp. KSB-10 TaxID=2901142 RepID=UPI001E5157F6|nr:flagellar export protein FliJ [Paralcaligenes sp. KSB-10]UHL65296.1 flagella biosynthesis chaperone FliJ [Paralcaligenes sp. KSB-10]